MSLFGAPAASTSAPAAPSLFGAPAAGASAPAPSSLFGSTQQQQQPASSGLFGAQPDQKRPAPGGGSLFGTTNSGAAQPAASQNSQLIGLDGKPSSSPFATAIPQTKPTSSLFNNTATNAAGASMFDSSIARPAGAQSVNGSQAGGALFDSLLAKAKKNGDGGDGVEYLPSIQLGLSDLQQRLRKLGPQGRAADRPPLDGRAHYLLAASGVDPGAAVKDLGDFAARAGGRVPETRPLAPSPGELDVETYLSNLQAKTTLSMIADGLERSVRDFDSFLEENVNMEWEAQRRRIYDHFGIKPREDAAGPKRSSVSTGRDDVGGFGRSKRSRNATGGAEAPGRATQRNSTFGKSGMLRSVIGSPSRIGSHGAQFVDVEMVGHNGLGTGIPSINERFLDDKQRQFIEKIHSLNDSRLMNLSYPIMHEFADVTKRSGDVHAPKIYEAYNAMIEVIGEDPDADPNVPGSTTRQRQFAQSYIHAQSRSPEASELRKRIINGANRYLEKQAFQEAEATIAKSPQEANLGGRPDVISKIRAYIRVLAAKKNLVTENADLQQVQGEYVWAIVFYLLRTGHVNEAAMYVNENQNHFRSIDRTFSSYINSYATSEDRRLKRPMQERCNNEYTQRVRNAPEGSIDPYRMACYKIVGRCELSNRSLEGLRFGIDDWIWLQFNLAREGDRTTELANETYGLADLQANVQEIGNKHFAAKSGAAGDDANGSFSMFFFLQILAGMYEAAVAYLYSFSRTDAVHFAIALEYYGLLRPADAMSVANELKSFNTKGVMQINFAPLVGLYTQDFRAADVAAAVDYIVLICLNMDDPNNEADRQQAALCHEGLRALVLETREFSKLIGDIRPDGQRIRGMIEERGKLVALDDEADFLRTISLEAARAAEDSGRTTDAVLLNHLAGDYDAVIVLVSRTLSESISMDGGLDGDNEPLRLAPVKPRVEGVEAQEQAGTSLSLAAIDDPVELARTMLTMYERDIMFRRKIREPNRAACAVLLQMSEIKGLIQAQQWPDALDVSLPVSKFYIYPFYISEAIALDAASTNLLHATIYRKSAVLTFYHWMPKVTRAPYAVTQPSSLACHRRWRATYRIWSCGRPNAVPGSERGWRAGSSQATRLPQGCFITS